MSTFQKMYIRFIRLFIIPCEHATYLIAKREASQLSFKEKVQLKAHLVKCKYCRYFVDEVEFIEKGIDRMKKNVESGQLITELSASSKQKMQQRLQQELA